MSILKNILRFLRRCLLGLLVGYWSIFIGYSVIKLIGGGPSRVLSWYEHIYGTGIHLKGDLLVLREWSWKEFLAYQVIYLAITLILCFFEWPKSNSRMQ
jgi:hypothetical protein